MSILNMTIVSFSFHGNHHCFHSNGHHLKKLFFCCLRTALLQNLDQLAAVGMRLFFQRCCLIYCVAMATMMISVTKQENEF